MLGRFVTGKNIRRITRLLQNSQQDNQQHAQLAHVARVMEMGRAASNIAHEFNQTLSATANYLGALRQILDRTDASALKGAREATERALAQVQRAADIVRRLREFIQKSDPARKPENIIGVLEEAGALTVIANKDVGVSISYQVAANLPPVMVDKVQIQQVMVNLLQNATEAMEASSRREITVEAAPAERNLVEISVADTGRGISQEVADKLFQPFVTTKAHGMGIGLFLSRSIIEAHGGRLWAEIDLIGGAIFRFTVPSAA